MADRTRTTRKTSDEVLDELLPRQDAADVFRSGTLIDDLKKAVAECALDAEMEAHLEREGGEDAGNHGNPADRGCAVLVRGDDRAEGARSAGRSDRGGGRSEGLSGGDRVGVLRRKEPVPGAGALAARLARHARRQPHPDARLQAPRHRRAVRRAVVPRRQDLRSHRRPHRQCWRLSGSCIAKRRRPA